MAVDTEWARDGKLHDSVSGVSNVSSGEDDTDEFGRIVAQHARDEQRLSRVLNGHKQPFRKARPSPGIGAALDDMNGIDRVDFRSMSSGASDSGIDAQEYTSGSDPPLNVPREWGRKGRSANGWLRKLADKDFGPERPASADGIDSRKQLEDWRATQDVDWEEVTNRPAVPLERDTPLSAKSRRGLASAVHDRGGNDPMERLQYLDSDHDFTAGSILESTPAIPPRRRGWLGERQTEINSVQVRGIATDRLSRISERSPESVRKELESRLSRLSGRSLQRQYSGKDNEEERHRHDDKENKPIKALTGPSDPDDHEKRGSDETEQRPVATRTESLDMLKRLARVTSISPMPVQTDTQAPTSKLKPRASANESRALRQSSALAPEVANAEKQPPSSVRATPRTSATFLGRTPKIIGGWIDTPFTRRHDNAQPRPPDQEVPKPDETKADIHPVELAATSDSKPRSALSALLHPTMPRESSSTLQEPPLDPEFKLGDDTLRSLESLISPSAEQTADLSNTLQLDTLKAELDALHSGGRPLTQADRDREAELLAIEGMNDRLRAARRGVREVGKGLRGVERAFEASASASAYIPRKSRLDTCAACEDGVLFAAGREVLSIFVSSKESALGDEMGPPWWRDLTWSGIAVFTVLAWYLLESAACRRYCQPVFAPAMKGFGVDPEAPRWPFVLPVVVMRPFAWFWRPLLAALLWAGGGVWSAVLAYVSILWAEDPSIARPSSSTMPVASRMGRHGRWDETRPVVDMRDKSSGAAETWTAPETMDADEVIDIRAGRRDGVFDFANLWSWRQGAGRERVVTDTAEEIDTTAREHSWREDRLQQGDTRFDASATIWETGDAMGDDEVVG